MGTSKGYIMPTKQHWTEAKRAATQLMNENNTSNREKLIRKYAIAMQKDNEEGKRSIRAIKAIIALSQSISSKGITQTLKDINKEYLTDRTSEEILEILLNEYTGYGNLIDNNLELHAISIAFKELNIKKLEDLGNIPVETLLKEIIIEYIDQNFKFRFEEKINKGKTPEETKKIINGISGYMRNKLTEELDVSSIKDIDFTNLQNDKIIEDKITEAYEIFKKLYGEE